MISHLLSLIFPQYCAHCKKPGRALCTPCLQSLPLSEDIDEEGMWAMYSYSNAIVRNAVWELKYHNHGDVARALVDGARESLLTFISEQLHSTQQETIYLVPIPLFKNHHTKRLENQSVRIASWIQSTIPYSKVTPLLQKITPTLSQAKIASRAKRLTNVEHTMHCETLSDTRALYVIVDDVITTGATAQEAIRALKSAGAQRILCIALAHGYARK